MTSETFFGSDAQQSLLRKGASAYHLFRDHPHYTYYGRTVGITSLDDVPFETLVALSRLQGNSTLSTFAKENGDAIINAAENAGLSANVFARWTSAPDCLKIARDVIATRALPENWTLLWLGPETPNDLRHKLADLALSVGVLPPNLSVLAGEIKPGVCAMAVDAHGDVVSCAAAAMYPNAEPVERKTPAWWGMLATRKDQRGRGLSVTLGAAAMVEMATRYGYTDFFTGVTPGNAPSEAVCARMGLFDEGTLILSAVDPTLMPGGRMTK